jgi:hypothetical protein
MTKKELHSLIREIHQEVLMERSIMGWLIDKAETIAKGVINKRTEYQYARILNDPDFRKLSQKFGMSEKEFTEKAAAMIKKDPEKFANLLAYDIKKSRYGKFF